MNIRTVSNNHTVQPTDSTIVGLASVIVTLESAVGNTGRFVTVKNPGPGIITVVPRAGELIDGAAFKQVTAPNASVFHCTGTGWVII